MFALAKLLAVAAAAEVAVGAIGAATHPDHHAAAASTAAAAPVPVPVSAASTASPAGAGPAGTPGLSSSFIASNLIDPADMGGYYRPSSEKPKDFLGSAPCLASLLQSPSQSGYGAEVLAGPDRASTPTFVEVVASYPADTIAAVDRDVSASIGSCKTLSFDFGGSRVDASLARDPIPPVGDADQAWTGKFDYRGIPMSIQLGTVQAGQSLVTVVWIDTDPGANPIMGGFASTLSLAIGKLA